MSARILVLRIWHLFVGHDYRNSRCVGPWLLRYCDCGVEHGTLRYTGRNGRTWYGGEE